MDTSFKNVKRLELLGALGAGILGAGIGLLLSRWLLPFALPILIVGIVSHVWAMWAKKRMERQFNLARPAWVIAAEWICWLMIASLIVYVAAWFAQSG